MDILDHADDRAPMALIFHPLADRRLVREVATRKRVAHDADVRGAFAILRREISADADWNTQCFEVPGKCHALLGRVPPFVHLWSAARARIRLALDLKRAARVIAAKGRSRRGGDRDD